MGAFMLRAKQGMRFCLVVVAAVISTVAFTNKATAQNKSAHNVILFIPDGLRVESVNPESTPTFARVRDQGVRFANSHSVFPTLTMVNAAAMGLGHFPGDTGSFANTIYTAFPVPSAGGSSTPMIENDAILGELNTRFGGNYLNEETVLAAARKAGFLTAAVGKVGPAAVYDVTERSGDQTIIVDDSTGRTGSLPTGTISNALHRAGLPSEAPARGENAKAGDAKTPGTTVANVEQQRYFVDVVTRLILPRFKEAGKPFVLVFWSRDPDGTQHNQGDSLGQLVPGINGPASQAAIKNADDNLAAILDAVKALGLDSTTDVIVSADHGFSTISKDSQTSAASKITYEDVPAGLLPPGFVAIDIAKTLNLPLFDPDAKSAPVDFGAGRHTSKANGLIGKDAAAPDVVVAANGGMDLVYLPKPNAKDLAGKIVDMLLGQDYVSGLFVDDSFGTIPGTLPLSAIHLKGSALTPVPAIVINFRSFAAGCDKPLMCAVNIADHTLQQGQGMHGSFSRADTSNFMAAIGPSFRSGYVDRAPASNADLGMTVAHLLNLKLAKKGELIGRPLTESLKDAKEAPQVKHLTRISAPANNGLQTILMLQVVGNSLYFDAAGFPRRTVGLDETATEPLGKSAPRVIKAHAAKRHRT
jgi:arylsulfatase A-like enzyme